MLKEIPMYTLVCDGEGCKEDILDGSDYGGLSDSDLIKDYCEDSNWQEIDGKDYCPKHWEWDEDGDEPIVKKTIDVTGGVEDAGHAIA